MGNFSILIASSISFVSSPSIVNITSSLKSVLPSYSSSKTWSGISFNSSSTSSGNSSSISYLAAILNISTPGSSWWPNIFTIAPL